MDRDARADDEPSESVRVDYAAPATCPSRETFLAGVRSRTTRMHLASGSAPARTFVVVLEDAARGADGRVTIRDPDGRELRREVKGASCEEVADVLALVVALAIDPRASTAPRAFGSASTAPAEAASAPAPAPSSSATRPPPTTPAPETPSTPPPERAHPASAPPRFVAGASLSWAAGAGASGSSGVTPSLLFGPYVFVEARVTGDVGFTPRLRVSFERTASGRLDVAGGGARFTWTVARADGCVAGWRLGRFRISPCIGVDAGTLGAVGTGIDHARDATRPWFAIGPTARASWSFLGPLFVELDVFARAALVRSQFFFEPSATVYDAPVLGAGLGLAFGASF